MNFLVVDNRDSFTFNLVDALRVAGAQVSIFRNTVDPGTLLSRAREQGAALLISPGPGSPDDAGCSLPLVRLARNEVPLVGICLGHQAIVAEAGGTVERASAPCHGKVSRIAHEGTGPFAGLASPLPIGRYHSLCTPVASLPGRFTVDAELGGMAIAIRDDEAAQLGLQFHPESILTPAGDKLIVSIIAWARDRWSALATRQAA
ncbi:anthranilate synthase component II [Sphingomicrobium clamense]|uniref:anthranilate synthase n=1 Tax=Sphingomicrobium clamense TaxID=2851013 RepID=A0ABS6V359_9SPHN|nr:aminodeoxychorismate/anthranilate synthase component II [Sphingomicrobium sp. B8]MBW0143976.1 aminodeoxychorismate/anthranilate synthase component II [Sphingomicrobium sp. B8]